MSRHARAISEDIYGPNFGNAFPSTAAAPSEDAPSWNPAWREHNAMPESEQDDDFFDRYPDATPKKRSQPGNSLGEDDAEVELRESSTSSSRLTQARDGSVATETQPSLSAIKGSVDGPLAHVTAPQNADFEEEDDEALLRPYDGPQEQESHLDDITGDAPESAEVPEQQDHEEGRQTNIHMSEPEVEGITEEKLARPEAHYEHQGDLTEMEAAVDESAAAPLMDDEEALPTTEVVGTAPGTEMHGELDGRASPTHPPSKPQAAPPQIDRSFTTNFTDIPKVGQHALLDQEQAPAPQADAKDEWPAFGDDKTFGDLLDDEGDTTALEPARSRPAGDWPAMSGDDDDFGACLGDHQAVPSSDDADHLLDAVETGDAEAPPAAILPAKEDDIAAAWGAVLDDDDLLDESNELDPSTLFGDDDNDFLEDDDPVPTSEQSETQTRALVRPQAIQQRSVSYNPSALQHNQYGVPSPQMFGQHGRSVGTPDTGLFDLYNQPSSQQAPVQQSSRPALSSAQSFADKSKGGYQSPYDLPMDVSTSRRRPPHHVGAAAAAPPRTSSYSSNIPAEQSTPPRAPSATARPTSSDGAAATLASSRLSSVRSAPNGDSGFFADLPVVPKLRAKPSIAYIPQAAPTGPLGPPVAMQQQTPQAHPSRPALIQQHSTPAVGGLGLRQPERLPLLPEQPTAFQAPALHAPSVPTSRYSPNAPAAPGPAQSRYSPAPPAPASTTSRYSPAPVAQPGQSRQRYGPSPTRHPSSGGSGSGSNPFAPRTSSPLAFQTEKPHPALPSESGSLPGLPHVNGTYAIPPAQPLPTQVPSPQRPRTQSPSATMKNPRMAVQSLDRPTSAAGVPTARSYAPAPQPSLMRTQSDIRSIPQQRSGAVLPHRRQFSRELPFATPQDERSQDPLLRWQGHPIFTWTASGSVLSSFPKQTPYYAAGHAIPTIKCTPGSITLQDSASLLPMDDRDARFPGPLAARSKGRKKDVLAWLGGKIEDLERNYETARLDFTMDPDLRKRVEEKLVLWKIAKIFVEHDGVLEGKPEIVVESRGVLLPNLAQMHQISDMQSPMSASIEAEPVDKQIVMQLRQALLDGDRDRAVWLAEEKKLWGHAMLIASTLGPDVWKQIIQSFVRSQVKSVGNDARSMATLYQIFAGNSEDCVDELVPPSARAGFQMINKSDGTVSGNPLEGLDQWRETLGLVVGNRTPNDTQSLLSLGKLLASYGRVEAAHTCYLFARSSAKHSGADDSATHFVLLGANHQSKDETFGGDLDSILLTEIYEWSSSLSLPSTTVPYVPHLQSFKLVHAQELAANGLKTKAQQYCDHITSAYTSTTRPSPYYHPVFTQAVADLGAFLAQSPHDSKGSAGLFRKEVMSKASSGAASWFTKFVSGEDDSNSNSSGLGNDPQGTPFGGVNGGTPSLSRVNSSVDMYNSMGGMVESSPTSPAPYAQQSNPYASTAATSRYAPYSAQTQATESRPAASLSAAKYAPLGHAASAYTPQEIASPLKTADSLGVPLIGIQQATPIQTRPASNYGSPYGSPSRQGSAQDLGSRTSHEIQPMLAEVNPYSYMPAPPEVEESHSEEPRARPNNAPSQWAIGQGSANEESSEGYPPPTSGHGASTSGYGYEPPTTSYQPYEPGPDSPEDAPKPKKKGIMDLDDDDDAALAKQVNTLKNSQADRDADEAFRKAAEADASRNDDGADGKKGWFGGWFKKDANAMPGPIRAKLGEESSFVYDENLKKWVNKKGGSETSTPAAATPPPPRVGPPSRMASSSMGPPSGPPTRVPSASGTGLPMGTRPPTSGSGPAMPGSTPPSRAGTPASQDATALNGESTSHFHPIAPPSRPGTGMSNASSLDDLLAGPPGGGNRKISGTAKAKKKGGRYVDVMAGK